MSDTSGSGPLEELALPRGMELTRVTPEFTSETVPTGLLSAHRVAPGVWGLVKVHAGSVRFVAESTGDERTLHPGETQVIEPDVAHHLEVAPDARFVIEFYR